MWNYLKNQWQRKVAKRVTKKYPTHIDLFEMPDFGKVKFANWDNPLVAPKSISQDNVDFFRKFLKEGDMGIDIGGNIGHMTIPMGLAAGKSGQVVAFDPNPYVFEILTQNAGLNPDHTNIAVHNVAITETDGDFYYNSSEASFNNGGISETEKNRHGKYSLGTKVPGVKLETFLEKNYSDKLAKLKLIKIDTEGYDIEIIKSIADLLRKYRPTVITECFGRNPVEKKYEQYEFLKGLGYSVYYFSDFVGNAQIEPISSKEDMLKRKHFDLYAIFEN